MKEEIYLGGRMVGYVEKEKGCYVTFRSDIHIFQKYHGFGISKEIIDKLIQNDISLIVINYDNTKAFWVGMNKFLEKGIKYNQRGDEQIILPLEYWTIDLGADKPDVQKKL